MDVNAEAEIFKMFLKGVFFAHMSCLFDRKNY